MVDIEENHTHTYIFAQYNIGNIIETPLKSLGCSALIDLDSLCECLENSTK